MARLAARVDSNQAIIIEALRQAGASVTPTHMVGHGFPDAAIGWRGQTFLAEFKVGQEPLTKDEAAWHAGWKGQVLIIRTTDEAIRLLQKAAA